MARSPNARAPRALSRAWSIAISSCFWRASAAVPRSRSSTIRWSHFVGGRQRATAYAGPQGEVAGIERDSLLGVYRALFPLNVPIDYVHINELSGALQQYKLVILPYPLMLPEAAADTLKAYVRSGGHLVAEARLGWSNERGMATDRIPGMGLWEVMGCRETARPDRRPRAHRSPLERRRVARNVGGRATARTLVRGNAGAAESRSSHGGALRQQRFGSRGRVLWKRQDAHARQLRERCI